MFQLQISSCDYMQGISLRRPDSWSPTSLIQREQGHTECIFLTNRTWEFRKWTFQKNIINLFLHSPKQPQSHGRDWGKQSKDMVVAEMGQVVGRCVCFNNIGHNHQLPAQDEEVWCFSIPRHSPQRGIICLTPSLPYCINYALPEEECREDEPSIHCHQTQSSRIRIWTNCRILWVLE